MVTIGKGPPAAWLGKGRLGGIKVQGHAAATQGQLPMFITDQPRQYPVRGGCCATRVGQPRAGELIRWQSRRLLSSCSLGWVKERWSSAKPGRFGMASLA